MREAFHQTQPGTLHDFEGTQQEARVVHLSVTGFLRQFPHKWHLEDIQRFGTVVGKTADAVQCSYITANDAALGNIRVFPLPLLERVYEILAPEKNWPVPPRQLALDDPRRPVQETVKSHQRVAKHLRTLKEAVANDGLRHSIEGVLQYLEKEVERLGVELKVQEADVTAAAAEEAAA